MFTFHRAMTRYGFALAEISAIFRSVSMFVIVGIKDKLFHKIETRLMQFFKKVIKNVYVFMLGWHVLTEIKSSLLLSLQELEFVSMWRIFKEGLTENDN